MTALTDFSAFILLPLAGAGLLLARDWRWLAVSLAGLGLGCFLLTLNYWPLNMAAAALVTIWMSAAVLGSSHKTQAETAGPLVLFLAVVVFIAGLRVSFDINAAFESISTSVAFGAAWSIGLGLLQISLARDASRSVLGLLTLLQGFQIFFAVFENSILVSALLAAVCLGLGLTGAAFSAEAE